LLDIAEIVGDQLPQRNEEDKKAEKELEKNSF